MSPFRFFSVKEKHNKKDNWVPFYFESNSAWGYAKTREEWDVIKGHYEKDMGKLDPSRARQACTEYTNWQPKDEVKPNFGFRMEHTGTETLADFIKKHNMVL